LLTVITNLKVRNNNAIIDPSPMEHPKNAFYNKLRIRNKDKEI